MQKSNRGIGFCVLLCAVLCLVGCEAEESAFPEHDEGMVYNTSIESETPEKDLDTDFSSDESNTVEEEGRILYGEGDGYIIYGGVPYVDADPPYIYGDVELPDFLTEEQKILYRQASSIFRFFNGDSMGVGHFMTLQEVEAYEQTLVETENGYPYCLMHGKYKNWDDFCNMVLNVFTEEYFDTLNVGNSGIEAFIQIDGNTYAICADKGSAPGYGVVPDTYTLVSATEDEIVFTVTCGYALGTDVETGKDRIEYKTFDVVLNRTEIGWRFSKFNCGARYREETETTDRVEETEPLVPDPDTCLFHSRNGSVYQWEDDTLYIVPAKWDAFFWQVEGAYRVWIDDENTFS